MPPHTADPLPLVETSPADKTAGQGHYATRGAATTCPERAMTSGEVRMREYGTATGVRVRTEGGHCCGYGRWRRGLVE